MNSHLHLEHLQYNISLYVYTISALSKLKFEIG